MEGCDDCRFTYADLPVAEVPGEVRRLAGELAGLLGDGRVRQRPAPEVWSPLEYACHVRDVLVVQRGRLGQAQAEDCPEFVPMGRDELLVARAYAEQDPANVAAELVAAGESFAAECEGLPPGAWDRTGIYQWPVRAERDLRWLARHTVHEARHHLADVRAALI